MKNLKYLAFAFILGLVAISCGDDDSTAPVVNITSPAASSSYSVSDTINLVGSVTEDTKLETVTLTSDLGIDQNVTPLDSDTSHLFNYNITLDSLTTPGNYSLTVTATDEAGNVGSDNVSISIQ